MDKLSRERIMEEIREEENTEVIEEEVKPQVCINLGSGYRYLNNWINIDIREECKPDIVCDISESLPFDDNSVDFVRAWDILEHIPTGKTIHMIEEIWRVLKPEGIFEFFVPSTDGRGAFQDPMHVSYWNINSWLYFVDPDYRHLYGIKADFQAHVLEDVPTDIPSKVLHTHGILTARKG
jgi:predicted SAM-dependent methyltransferase